MDFDAQLASAGHLAAPDTSYNNQITDYEQHRLVLFHRLLLLNDNQLQGPIPFEWRLLLSLSHMPTPEEGDVAPRLVALYNNRLSGSFNASWEL